MLEFQQSACHPGHVDLTGSASRRNETVSSAFSNEVADDPQVSVVVPVRDEQESVVELARLLKQHLPPSHEVLFVDDGSTDETWQRLTTVHEPGRVRLIKLRGPSGKSAALMAGFASTRAPVVFTMDGDLQDDPAEIPVFLSKLEEGYGLVSGWKKTRHDPWHKVLPSRIFNTVMRIATGLSLHDMNCGFKCYQGDLARSLRIYGDQHRFIPVFAAHLGYRIDEVVVRHHPRRHGRSKYGISRLLKGFLDLGTVLLRTRFRGRPAHAFGTVALAGLAASLVLAALSIARVLPRPAVLAGVAVCAVLAISSAVFLGVGWLAEVLLDAGPPESIPLAPDIEESRD